MKPLYFAFLMLCLAFGSIQAQTILTPPTNTPRTMAEWEEQEALVVAWSYYNDNSIRTILVNIVKEAREVADVVIVCSDSTTVKTYLTSQGVDVSSNVRYATAGINSIWARDYSGNTVYLDNGVDERAMVDWIYNRDRPLDDDSPVAVAELLDMPIYRTLEAPFDLVHTGGNYMSDGLGRAFSSELVLAENGPENEYGTSNWNEVMVDSLMKQFLGTSQYALMPALPYDVINHIDMHMKLIDESTILVGQYPEGVSDGPQIEANIEFVLDNFTDYWGQPFRVIRIPMPPDGNQYPNNGGEYRTYTNAVFVNQKVLVPTYTQQYDTTALRIWEEALPGTEIVGINCNAIIGFLGAIHCITHENGVAQPLLIQHRRLDDQLAATEFYPLSAIIKHASGIADATLFYRMKGVMEYQSIPLLAAGDDIYEAEIPKILADTVLQYYIAATANDGKAQVRPLAAPTGYFEFRVAAPSVGSSEIGTSALQNPFPNPASALTCVPLTLKNAQAGEILLFDIFGKEQLAIFRGDLPAGSSRYYFDAAQLPSGVYDVRLRLGNEEQSKILVIK